MLMTAEVCDHPIEHAFGLCGCAPAQPPAETTLTCGICDDDDSLAEEATPNPPPELASGDASPPVHKRDADGKFKCPSCEYKTKKKSHLKQHLMVWLKRSRCFQYRTAFLKRSDS